MVISWALDQTPDHRQRVHVALVATTTGFVCIRNSSLVYLMTSEEPRHWQLRRAIMNLGFGSSIWHFAPVPKQWLGRMCTTFPFSRRFSFFFFSARSYGDFTFCIATGVYGKILGYPWAKEKLLYMRSFLSLVGGILVFGFTES